MKHFAGAVRIEWGRLYDRLWPGVAFVLLLQGMAAYFHNQPENCTGVGTDSMDCSNYHVVMSWQHAYFWSFVFWAVLYLSYLGVKACHEFSTTAL